MARLLAPQRDRLRYAALPLFGVLVDLVWAAEPCRGRPDVVAGALWAILHGTAQLA